MSSNSFRLILYEPFGLSVLEAAYAGCALSLSDLPTLRENWEGAAVFVDPHDAEAWKEAIQTVLDQPHLQEALALSAQQRATAFAPWSQAKAYVSAIEI